MSAALSHVSVARDALVTLVARHGRDLPLDRAAALFAAEEDARLDPAAPLAALDALAAEIHIPEDADLYEQIARISHQLFIEDRFSGDEESYDHPDNCRLDRVLARRKGMPILLSLVVMEVGRRLGIPIDGVGFPGHFVVSPRSGEPRFYLDPFHRGQILRDEALRGRLARMAGACEVDPATWARFTSAVDTTTILTRINNNLKRSYARRGKLEAALRAVERNLVLEPDTPMEIRDRGMLRARLGDREGAVADLEAYVAADPEAWDADRVVQVLDFLRRRWQD